MYKALSPDKDRWIFILSENGDEDTDSFVALLKYIRQKTGGKIVSVRKDDVQYRIVGDDFNLIYQWDSCFGISAVVPKGSNICCAFKFLQTCCEELNQKGAL